MTESEAEMRDLSKVDPKRLVKLIEKAQKKMPAPPPYTAKMASCWRCGGDGMYKWGAVVNGVVSHQGVCYRCGGNGKDPKAVDYTVDLESASPEWLEWAAEKIAKLDAANEKRRATKEAKRLAKEAAKEAEKAAKLAEIAKASEAYRKAVEAGEALRKVDRFAADILESVNKYATMSEKQESVLKRGVEMVAKRAAEDAAATPVIEGRIEISGEMKSKKYVENERYGGSWKMLVLDDRGFKVWGTIPSGLRPFRGDKVKFTATVEKSRDDECFGFYKRPTKAEVTDPCSPERESNQEPEEVEEAVAAG